MRGLSTLKQGPHGGREPGKAVPEGRDENNPRREMDGLSITPCGALWVAESLPRARPSGSPGAIFSRRYAARIQTRPEAPARGV